MSSAPSIASIHAPLARDHPHVPGLKIINRFPPHSVLKGNETNWQAAAQSHADHNAQQREVLAAVFRHKQPREDGLNKHALFPVYQHEQVKQHVTDWQAHHDDLRARLGPSEHLQPPHPNLPVLPDIHHPDLLSKAIKANTALVGQHFVTGGGSLAALFDGEYLV